MTCGCRAVIAFRASTRICSLRRDVVRQIPHPDGVSGPRSSPGGARARRELGVAARALVGGVGQLIPRKAVDQLSKRRDLRTASTHRVLLR